MKTCFKCGIPKPRSEFYKHPKMGDGLLGKCKRCTKLDSESRRLEKSKDPKWMAAERQRHRLKQARYRALGLASPVTQETRRRWAKRNPEKVKANRAANNAIRSGKLKKKKRCQRCLKPSKVLEKHHEDYSKPLEVEFLCPPCHGKTRHR